MSRGGQLIATSRDKGVRLWTREIQGTQTPWVAGDTVFVVDVTGKLIALTRKDGKVRWVTALPGDGRWNGPCSRATASGWLPRTGSSWR